MKNIVRLFAFIMSFFCFMSCENEFSDVLMRTSADPFDDAPVVDSFSTEHTIYLSWNNDEGADLFVLNRAVDSQTPVFYEIYRGNSTTYTDTDLEDNYRYIYRLDKTRGEAYFEGSTYGYGVSSSVRCDEFEPNDIQSYATELEYQCQCNMPCIRFYDGKTILDDDWFYVTIPARKTANISVEQTGISISEEEATYFNALILSSNMDVSVSNISPVLTIVNTSTEKRNFYFKIYPNTSKAFASSDTFFSNLTYTITLAKITS